MLALECPTFRCKPEHFDNLVFCHHNDIDNPLKVDLKDCNNYYQMSKADFWGEPIPRDEKQYCHHELNRCVSDPHLQIVNKKPGDRCVNNYECLSNDC